MTRELGAVFFDSGGTLTRPTRGSWWPKPRFEELVAAAGFPVAAEEDACGALAEGVEHLDRNRFPRDLDEELEAYVGFYRIVLRRLYGSAPSALVSQLASSAVYDLDQAPYPDVEPALDRLLAAGLAVGLVSNAGPSLQLRYRDMGLSHRFDPFVVSALVGVEKPSPGIYHHALELAGRVAGEVAFVDDVPANIESAARIGMRAILLERDGGGAGGGMPDLAAVLSRLGVGLQPGEATARRA